MDASQEIETEKVTLKSKLLVRKYDGEFLISILKSLRLYDD